MENKEGFSFTYSAEQQKEIEAIRQKYLPNEVDKMEQLRRLHAIPTQKAQAGAIAVGVIGALIMGTGMSFAMTDIGAVLGNLAMVLGVAVGIAGIVLQHDLIIIGIHHFARAVIGEVIGAPDGPGACVGIHILIDQHKGIGVGIEQLHIGLGHFQRDLVGLKADAVGPIGLLVDGAEIEKSFRIGDGTQNDLFLLCGNDTGNGQYCGNGQCDHQNEC